MPSYNDLRPAEDLGKQEHSLVFPSFPKKEKLRTIDNLLVLRKEIAKNIQVRKTDKNLILSSWNIKEFGHLKNRLPESYFYIAEILSNFDLVAVQEIKTGLKDLQIIMKLLGSDWRFLITDITDGTDGNAERFAYLYDTRRVNFTGLAGEITLWKDLFDEGEEIRQLKRTPYVTGFRAGWKSFALLNVHLQPNDDKPSRELRKREVELLLKALAEKKKRNSLWTENIIILGDFNLYKKDVETVKVFEQNDFFESDLLKGLNTNTAAAKETFDRMFFKKNEFFGAPSAATGEMGGVVEIFDMIYKLDGYGKYRDEMKKHKEKPETLVDDAAFERYFKNNWRKTQMSDHKPVWIELNIDSSDDFLLEKRIELES
ncbi:MAG: endonuclease/exonuclease/phosphatase family protein [Pyrinomonadaceae bacterium]|nr:endonuclease/exonuclease/phosphatase family protein [Pyrinomonadaceae bacterium]